MLVRHGHLMATVGRGTEGALTLTESNIVAKNCANYF